MMTLDELRAINARMWDERDRIITACIFDSAVSHWPSRWRA